MFEASVNEAFNFDGRLGQSNQSPSQHETDRFVLLLFQSLSLSLSLSLSVWAATIEIYIDFYPGVNFIITHFSDYQQFSAKNLRFTWQPML
jgi:hypothetical protein